LDLNCSEKVVISFQEPQSQGGAAVSGPAVHQRSKLKVFSETMKLILMTDQLCTQPCSSSISLSQHAASSKPARSQHAASTQPAYSALRSLLQPNSLLIPTIELIGQSVTWVNMTAI
jgi:hypothetical protein